MAKKPFVKPQMQVIMLPDLEPDTDLARMSDEELLALLRKYRPQAQRCYRASEQYIAREIAGQLVLVPADGAKLNGMIAMTPTGAFLMDQMKEKRTQADLAGELEKRYGIPPETARADTDAFLNKALRDGLVVAC